MSPGAFTASFVWMLAGDLECTGTRLKSYPKRCPAKLCLGDPGGVAGEWSAPSMMDGIFSESAFKLRFFFLQLSHSR